MITSYVDFLRSFWSRLVRAMTYISDLVISFSFWMMVCLLLFFESDLVFFRTSYNNYKYLHNYLENSQLSNFIFLLVKNHKNEKLQVTF